MSAALKFRFWSGAAAATRAQWVANSIPGCARGWERCVLMEVSRGGEVIGGVVFHDYNPEARTICMSAAGQVGWLTRRTIAAIHGYIFGDAGCQLALMEVSERNETMRRVARAVGYREHCIPRLRGPDEAGIIYALSDDEWRTSKFNR